jgi:hypothetical protein
MIQLPGPTDQNNPNPTFMSASDYQKMQDKSAADNAAREAAWKAYDNRTITPEQATLLGLPDPSVLYNHLDAAIPTSVQQTPPVMGSIMSPMNQQMTQTTPEQEQAMQQLIDSRKLSPEAQAWWDQYNSGNYVPQPMPEGPIQPYMPSYDLPTEATQLDWSNFDPSWAYAEGGNAGVPEYAAGGKFLRGGGDGMSDSIPAMIHGEKPQQAALADGEFVIPADVVSHLGNGSSEAGSRKLYDMMDKIRMARTGKKAQGKKINPDKFLPK